MGRVYRGWMTFGRARSARGIRFAPHTGALVAVVIVASMIGIPSARAAGGTEQWVARFPGPGYSVDDVAGIAVSPDGSRLFVTGTVAHLHGATFQTVSYDASGTQLWSSHYKGPGPYEDQAAGIAVSPDGSMVFVAGRSSTDTTKMDYITLAYDAATGTRVWKKRYSFTLGLSFDQPAALGVSPDGSTVFVTGAADGGPAGTDYVTVAYEAFPHAAGRSWGRPLSRQIATGRFHRRTRRVRGRTGLTGVRRTHRLNRSVYAVHLLQGGWP